MKVVVCVCVCVCGWEKDPKAQYHDTVQHSNVSDSYVDAPCLIPASETLINMIIEAMCVFILHVFDKVLMVF